MLKQVVITLAILGGISFAFTGCEEKNPTFTNYPLQNDGGNGGPGSGPGQGGPDTGDNSSQDDFQVAIAVYDEVRAQNEKYYWVDKVVNCYTFQGEFVASATTKDTEEEGLDDDGSSQGSKHYAIFSDTIDWKTGTQYTFESNFVGEYNNRDTMWRGSANIAIQNPQNGKWFTGQLEVHRDTF